MIVLWWDILKHFPACYKILKDLGYRGEYDPIVHDVGIPVIVRCLRSYDPKKGKFSTYMWPSLKTGFAAAMRTRYHGELNSNMPDEIKCLELEHRDHVLYLLKGLDKYDQHLLVLHFWKGLTYEELADTLGVAKSTVCNHIRRALDRCRRRHNASERGSE